jgi:predicted transposase/invertase (TIGR01784 family)
VKTDSVFFKIFQELPGVLFERLGESFELGGCYEFQSIEVKQTAFRIDGVFLPKPEATNQTVYFVEVQYQPDEFLYDRMFAEIGMYLDQNRRVLDWCAITIFPRRSLEPKNQYRHRSFVQGDQFRTIFLEDLLNVPTELIGIQIMQLIAAKPKITQRYLAQLASQL